MIKYALSFTAASIRRPECVILARAFAQTPDWDVVRHACIEEDLLMIRSESSRKRVSGELVKRLRNLSADELAYLALPCADADGQGAILWVAVCRTYPFVADFVCQVVADRWHSGKRDLPVGAYESFFEEASLVHPELARLSDLTRPRLRNQLYQMLRETGLVADDLTIRPYLVPLSAKDLLGPAELAFFPSAV